MKRKKSLGIWLDHASAHLMEMNPGLIVTKIIASEFDHEEKELTLKKSEKEMHKKEQQEEGAFYKEIGRSILLYEDVLLFGPTQAKKELLNILRKDHHFDKIKIEIRPADKMTENQEHAFVRDYFTTL